MNQGNYTVDDDTKAFNQLLEKLGVTPIKHPDGFARRCMKNLAGREEINKLSGDYTKQQNVLLRLKRENEHLKGAIGREIKLNKKLNTKLQNRKNLSQVDREIIREKLFTEQAGICALCGESMNPDKTDIDHIIPVSKGGSNDIANLQLACASCNRSKGNKILIK